MILRWLTGFGRFWYAFIIGDDWTVAATVAAALVATWLLHTVGVAAWWLPPVAAAGVVGVSLRRSSQRERRRREREPRPVGDRVTPTPDP